ncbi:hypothetical protein [Fodinibius salicampi]|nr:hypothetical protein [Fodinibius salicampi]
MERRKKGTQKNDRPRGIPARPGPQSGIPQGPAVGSSPERGRSNL